MAKMIPEKFPENTINPGEIELFSRLRDESGSTDWIVLHSVKLAHNSHLPEPDLDFVVIIPHQGIVCLEVKAAARVARENGQWCYGSGSNKTSRDPFKELNERAAGLRSFLMSRDPSLATIPIASAVVFTRAHANVITRGGEVHWQEWEMIDTNRYLFFPLPRLILETIEKSRHCTGVDQLTCAQLTECQCAKVVKLLQSGHQLNGDGQSGVDLTVEQTRALGAMDRNPRMIFTGAAGTGKTFLALEAAKKAAAEGNSVLLLCYNRLLGEWLAEESRKFSPLIAARTIHEHMRICAEIDQLEAAARCEQDGFLNRELPTRALEKLALRPQEQAFHKLIVDEAQEMLQDLYLDVMDLSLLRGLERGRWVIFGDFDDRDIYQRHEITIRDIIYSRCKYIPHFYCLNTNCRTVKSIADFANRVIAPSLYTEVLRQENGPSPKVLYYGSTEEQRNLLLQCLNELGREGYDGEDLVVISGHSGGREVASTIEDPSWRGRLKRFSTEGEKDSVRFGSIRDFKGMGAPAIIVTDLDTDELRDERQSLLYHAITRAQERLIVLSHISQKERLENC